MRRAGVAGGGPRGATLGGAATLAALACLVSGCPFKGQSGSSGVSSGSPTDSAKALHALSSGPGAKSHGVLDELFARDPAEKNEVQDHSARQPFFGLMRRDHAPAREGYDPLPEARAPRPARPPRAPRPGR